MNYKHIKNKALDKHIGKPLNTKQVANYLGVDEKTVRQYYEQLGGIRLGKKYIFFERRLIVAIQTQGQMDRLLQTDDREGTIQEGEGIPGEKGSDCMGSKHEEVVRHGISKPKEKDPYGLLPH